MIYVISFVAILKLSKACETKLKFYLRKVKKGEIKNSWGIKALW